MSEAFIKVCEAIDKKQNVFISGVGGCGKSYLMKQLYKHYCSKEVRCVLTSTTGISAYNLGGITLHSWSRIVVPTFVSDPKEWADNLVERLRRNKRTMKKYREMQILFVDEVSMLGANYLDVFNYICQELRQNPTTPMGGIQVVFGGDMMQLPPVRDNFPFESGTWNQLEFKYFRLVKAWRFDAQHWVDILQRARLGELNEADKQALMSRVNVPVDPKMIPPIFLASRNDLVDRINKEKLDAIDQPLRSFSAIDSVASLDTEGNVCTKVPTALPVEVTNQFMVEKKVDLKVGCQVMLLANLDVERGLTNGTRGVVVQINEKSVVVKFDKSIETIAERTFIIEDNYKYFARDMIPLRLAFATSIHKSQSLTLQSVEMDIGWQVFSEGQSYVALSRCRSLDGLYIRSLALEKIRPHPKALQFEKNFMKTCVDL